MKKETTVYGINDDDVITSESTSVALQNYISFCKEHNNGSVDSVLTECMELQDHEAEHVMLVQVISNEGKSKVEEAMLTVEEVQDELEENCKCMRGEDMFKLVLSKLKLDIK